MTNEVAVITGASSGIGAALAKQLGSKGHQLVLAARREKELKEVAKQAGTRALVVPTDVTRRADVEDLRSRALKEYGHVDVWVNNAGRGITKSVLDLTDQDVDEITSVVLKSVLYGMQAIIPHFQERGRGHLINVSSLLGRVPLVSHRSIYSAAKSGVNVITANARMDLKAKYFFFQAEVGIRGHCVTGVQTCALPICFDREEVAVFKSRSYRNFLAVETADLDGAGHGKIFASYYIEGFKRARTLVLEYAQGALKEVAHVDGFVRAFERMDGKRALLWQDISMAKELHIRTPEPVVYKDKKYTGSGPIKLVRAL